MRVSPSLLAAALVIASASPASGQDTLEVALPGITIEAARALETEATAPFAVAVRTRSAALAATEPGLSLQNALRGLPGLFVSDRGHYALGERILVRGMGFRSSFGVRGVQIVLDGIPLTLPDGQTAADIVDPAFVRRAELVRGPSSLYWGNTSGGILFLSTAPAGDARALRLRAMGGSHGLRHVSGSAHHESGRHRFFAYGSAVHREGFRDHSAGGFIRSGLHGRISLGEGSALQIALHGAVQDVEAPGSLTSQQVVDDRRQADPRYVSVRAGKKSAQLQGGATLHRATPLGLVSVTGYGLVRQLRNPLTFAYIDLDRAAGGIRVQLRRRGERVGWGVGLDAGFQRDDRVNANNDEGRMGSFIFLRQVERVRNVALFSSTRVRLAPQLSATAGIRFDGIRFAMDDGFPDNGDQSGGRNFRAVSPAVGVAYDTGDGLVFANVSTAFETPTTTELVNGPDDLGGFHDELNPQRTIGFEIGARGRFTRRRLHYDIAVYRLHISDRLVGNQRWDGRTWYTNEGRNLHQGVEVSLLWQAHPSLNVRATWSGGRYLFNGLFKGLRVPGVPEHVVYVSLETERRGFMGQIAARVLSLTHANSGNTESDKGYATVDIYAGHTSLTLGRVMVQPFVRLRNALGAQYNGSLVVNAFGRRYYEPAAGRTVQAGVNLAL